MLTTELTTAEAAAVGGILGGMAFFLIAFYVLLVIAGWQILKKAGEPGWKILIPIYNFYILYKIVGMKNWFWITLAVSVVVSIINAAQGYNGQADYDLAAHPMVVVLSAAQAIFMIVVEVMCSYRTSKAFGHGIGYTIGLIFLPNIFWLILGFGKSKYDKKILKK